MGFEQPTFEKPKGAQFPDETLKKIQEAEKKVENNPLSVSDEEIAKLEDEFNEGLLDVNLERSQYLSDHPDEVMEGEIEKLETYFEKMKEKSNQQLKEMKSEINTDQLISTSKQEIKNDIPPELMEKFDMSIEQWNIPDEERQQFRNEFINIANGKPEKVMKSALGNIILKVMKRAKELK